METESLEFGPLLRELRLAAGMSQEALAELARMSTGGISVLERGARRSPQRQTLELLADALNLSSAAREHFYTAARRRGNSRRHNLPFALTTFVGRQNSIASLQAQLTEHRLVSVTGIGGVGKTRLAIEAAHQIAESFSDGVWFIELMPLADEDLIAQRVVETLGVATSADTAKSSDWMSELSAKHQLLILDNCEHLLSACAALSNELLERCARLHILVTSREPLHLNGERVIRLEPLREQSAIELFLDRTRSASPDFSIPEGDSESWQQLQSICEHLDGIPMAIELAAARTSALSLKTIAENIGQRLKLLRVDAGKSLSRQKTMTALMDWSFDLLSDPEQRVFEILSIFGGGCTLEGAVDVCQRAGFATLDVLETLTSLVDKSLVVVDFDPDEPRYSLLEISREYAQAKLVLRGDSENIARHHALTFLQVAERLCDRWTSDPDYAWFLQAKAELENWRIAINWALRDRHDVSIGQRLAGSLQPVWINYALAEGRHWCDVAAKLIDETTPRITVAKLTYAKAIVAFLSGDITQSLEAGRRSVDEYRALNDAFDAVRALIVVGSALVGLERFSEGDAVLKEAMEIAERLGNPLLLAYVHQAVGARRGAVNDHEAARDHFAKALVIAQAASAKRAAGMAAANLAEAHFLLRDLDSAIALASQTINTSQTLGDAYVEKTLQKHLAKYLLARGRHAEAKKAAQRSLWLSSHARGTMDTALTLQILALIAALGPECSDRSASPDRERAARILGFIEARFAALNAHLDFEEERQRESLRTALERSIAQGDLLRIMSVGAAMTEGQVVDEAMAL